MARSALRVQPGELDICKGCFERIAVMPDFDHEKPVVIEVGGTLQNDFSRSIQSVIARSERDIRLVKIFAGQCSHRSCVDVRGIADNEIEGFTGKGAEQVGSDKIDSVFQSVAGDIALRNSERIPRDVCGIDDRFRKGMRHQDREASRACAQIECPDDAFRFLDPGIKLLQNEFCNEGARDDHALVDIEAEIAEPGFMGEIGDRDFFADSPLDQIQDQILLLRKEFRIQKGIEFVVRQMERRKEEIGRFIECIRAAMSIGELAAVETADCMAQEVPEREEAAFFFFVHIH